MLLVTWRGMSLRGRLFDLRTVLLKPRLLWLVGCFFGRRRTRWVVGATAVGMRVHMGSVTPPISDRCDRGQDGAHTFALTRSQRCLRICTSHGWSLVLQDRECFHKGLLKGLFSFVGADATDDCTHSLPLSHLQVVKSRIGMTVGFEFAPGSSPVEDADRI